MSVEGNPDHAGGAGGHSVVALSSSPRRRGNSRTLAEAVLEGAGEGGHRTELVHLADHIQGLLRNCRECRRSDGSCGIAVTRSTSCRTAGPNVSCTSRAMTRSLSTPNRSSGTSRTRRWWTVSCTI